MTCEPTVGSEIRRLEVGWVWIHGREGGLPGNSSSGAAAHDWQHRTTALSVRDAFLPVSAQWHSQRWWFGGAQSFCGPRGRSRDADAPLAGWNATVAGRSYGKAPDGEKIKGPGGGGGRAARRQHDERMVACPLPTLDSVSDAWNLIHPPCSRMPTAVCTPRHHHSSAPQKPETCIAYRRPGTRGK